MWQPAAPGPVCEGGRKHAAWHPAVAMQSAQHCSFVRGVGVPLRCLMSPPLRPDPLIQWQLPGGAGGRGGEGELRSKSSVLFATGTKSSVLSQ